MMLVPKQSAPGPSPSPISLDPEPYQTVPLFNQQSTLLALVISFMVFSWICFLLRLHARVIILRSPGWDDVFMILTMLSTTMSSIVLCISPDLGFGTSIYKMTVPEIEELLKLMYIGNFPYPMSVAFIKIALLFQYLRIFPPGSRYRIICKWMVVIIAMWGFAFAILTWIPCSNVAAYWDFSITDARCWGLGSRDLHEFMSVFVSQAISTTVFDFIVFMIPISLFFKPDTQMKTRISLLCLFTVGLAVNLCSIWRMVYVINLYMAGKGSFDPTWYSPTAAGLACIEVHLAAVCAALPVFWPVWEKTWLKIFVTFEVSVTEEYGKFPSKTNDVELQSASSDRNLTLDPSQMAEGWEPFVGDETTGLGENETVVESLAKTKRSRKVKEIFQTPRQ